MWNLRRPDAVVVDTVTRTICFGLAGAMWSLPPLRRRRERRAENCGGCHRHQIVVSRAMALVAVLLVACAVLRGLTELSSTTICHSRVSADGRTVPEPLLDIAPPRPWTTVRNVLVAPSSGLGLAVSRAMGMRTCSGPPLLVTFWPPPHTSGGGSILGDVFVTWMPSNRTPVARQRTSDYSLASEGTWVRFGPNISDRRVDEEALGRHESAHVDQQAVAAALGGPSAFPVTYLVDNAFFPAERNHFERAAGLDGGGYRLDSPQGPSPTWPQVAVIGAAVLFGLRRTVRRCVRVALGGRTQWRTSAPGTCPAHTRGLMPLRLSTSDH